MKIIEYKKHITSAVTKELRDVDGVELCTLGDTTYFVIPGTALPTGQAAEIQSTIKATTMTEALNDQIRASSPNCLLIAARQKQKLAEAGYSAADTDFFLHLGVAAQLGIVTLNAKLTQRITAYLNAFKQAYIWGEQQYAALGL